MTRRRRDERGTAIVEFSWMAILLMVPLVWVILSVFEVQRGAFAVHAAARAAGRAFVLAPDDAVGIARAQAAAAQTLASQGSPGMTAHVEHHCTTRPNCHLGTSVVTVTVTSSVELPLLPRILDLKHRSFQLSARHSVPFGQYVEAGDPSEDEEQGQENDKESGGPER
ncbi:TadE/TadG family type IV pilus assembly protein [Nocardioides gansuensis]|uniref:TadE/TadG family type IV pilus assembly protein n=1 Tax=Nocardioides gansuensis TaxID=2138300 RepID=UPI001BA5CCCB|nr:hypothetical protein [Nocardioides gansuensis]